MKLALFSVAYESPDYLAEVEELNANDYCTNMYHKCRMVGTSYVDCEKKQQKCKINYRRWGK